jgi:hypothetical protein
MSNSYKTPHDGLVDTIVLIVVALIILGFFNIDLKEVFSAPLVTENIRYAWDLFINGIRFVIQYIADIIANI